MFSNLSRFNEEIVLSASNFSIRKTKRLYLLMGFVFISLGIVFIILGQSIIGFPLFCLFFGAVFLTSAILFLEKQVRKSVLKQAYGNPLVNQGTRVQYLFAEDKFVQIVQLKGEIWSQVVQTYEQTFKLMEDEKYFFLFISNSVCYVVEKSGMLEGTSHELSNFLREKIAYYQTCYKTRKNFKSKNKDLIKLLKLNKLLNNQNENIVENDVESQNQEISNNVENKDKIINKSKVEEIFIDDEEIMVEEVFLDEDGNELVLEIEQTMEEFKNNEKKEESGN